MPLVIPFYQDLGCCPLLFLCALIVERRLLFPGPKMLLVLVSLGLSGTFGAHLLYILGVFWAGPNPASAIQPIIPVWTAILALVTCTERLPSLLHTHAYLKLLGVLTAAGGAIELVLTTGHTPHGLDTNSTIPIHANSTSAHSNVGLQLVGYVSLFANTMCVAIYVLIQKRFIFNSPTNEWRKHPIYVTAYSYLFGALFMTLASTYYFVTGRAHAYAITGTSVYTVIYAVFITSGTCSILLMWTTMHLSPTIVTAFWPLQVLVSVVVSYFVTGDQLAPYQYVGAVMLVVALFLVLFANQMEERLQEGKSVPRVDCRMTRRMSPVAQSWEDGSRETAPLLSQPTEAQKLSVN